MPDPRPSAAALLARGVPLPPLVTGDVVRIRYSMLALARLEERFGSVMGAARAMQHAGAVLEGKGDAGEGRAGIFGVLLDVIAAGLIGQRVPSPFGGDDLVDLSSDRETLGVLLDEARLLDVFEAFGQAFKEAMPDVAGAAGRPTEGEPAASAGSPSPTSTPSRADEQDAPTTSSGG